MITVWKYELEPQITLEIPGGATILSVGAQGESICLWAQVDTDAPAEKRHFRVVATGEPLGEAFRASKFIGTVQMNMAYSGSNLVMHVFEAETNVGGV